MYLRPEHTFVRPVYREEGTRTKKGGGGPVSGYNRWLFQHVTPVACTVPKRVQAVV